MILEVIDIGHAARRNRVPVIVIGVARGEAVVGVIIEQAGRHRRQARGHLLAIAYGVIAIADRAVDRTGVAGDGFAGQPVEIVVASFISG